VEVKKKTGHYGTTVFSRAVSFREYSAIRTEVKFLDNNIGKRIGELMIV